MEITDLLKEIIDGSRVLNQGEFYDPPLLDKKTVDKLYKQYCEEEGESEKRRNDMLGTLKDLT